MGVGRDSKNIFDNAYEQENDMFILGNQSGQSTDEEDTPPSTSTPQDSSSSSRNRRLRARPRSSSLEACLTGMYRRCGARQARRSAHIKHLLSLKLEEEESDDVLTPTYTIHSTPFSQLLQEQHKMQAWNDFVNCSEEDQERILQSRTSALSLSSIREESDEDDDDDQKNGNTKKSPSRSLKKSAKGSNRNEKSDDGTLPRVPSNGEEDDDNRSLDDSWEKVESPDVDKRTVHPSFSAEKCFQRVDRNLRSVLTRRHLPLGIVSQLEKEVVEFFTDYPGCVYINHWASSFERLLLHGVCQYLGLYCQSFEKKGERRTHVENKNSSFTLPSLPLAQYLEQRS